MRDFVAAGEANAWLAAASACFVEGGLRFIYMYLHIHMYIYVYVYVYICIYNVRVPGFSLEVLQREGEVLQREGW